MRLIVLRPEPQASRMVVALAAAGIAAVAEPMLDILALPAPAARVASADPVAGALLITSAQAAAVLAADPAAATLLHRPVLAVGDATAAAMERAGFADVRSAGGTADDLVRLALASGHRRFVHVCGRHRAGDVSGQLAAAGCTVTLAEIYEARAREALGPEAAAALAGGAAVGIVVASARTAGAFAETLRRSGRLRLAGRLHVAAMSAAAAAPLAGLTASVRLSEEPTGESLFRAAVALAAGLDQTRGG